MGLRDFVEQRRAEQERPKTLAALRAAKKANNNHEEMKPKTLAALRARKRAEPAPEPPKGLAAVMQAKRAAQSSQQDFHRGGLLYHNVRQINHYWAVDVSNGDKTYTLHNRHGAWFHDIGHNGRMVEPVRVARALGTNVEQLDISLALSDRLDAEWKARGILTREQRARQREDEARAERRKRKHVEEAEA